ncbi:MAG TPA: AAA family ATPase [Blastocatellia bacterium]|nr:AAA family ATPase [Blastocatellia bacterium]
MPIQRIVFAGGPGSGKTTLLHALQQRGYPVVVDSARAIIQARKSQSLSPRPLPLEFAQAILRLDIQQYGEHAYQSGLVFYERGVVDALGMLHEVGALPENELKALLSTYPYHRQVFLFPPWEAIYANDDERDQTFVEAVSVYRRASGWYERCGYDVVEVPKVGVAERCAYVLQALGAAA